MKAYVDFTNRKDLGSLELSPMKLGSKRSVTSVPSVKAAVDQVQFEGSGPHPSTQTKTLGQSWTHIVDIVVTFESSFSQDRVPLNPLGDHFPIKTTVFRPNACSCDGCCRSHAPA